MPSPSGSRNIQNEFLEVLTPTAVRLLRPRESQQPAPKGHVSWATEPASEGGHTSGPWLCSEDAAGWHSAGRSHSR